VYGANFGGTDTTSIYFNGYAAPVLFASPGQFNVEVPWEAAGTNSTIGAIVNGRPSNIVTSNVSAYSPVVFGTFHADGTSAVTAGNPASANEAVTIYATGLGPVTGAMVTGQPASSTTFQKTTQDPTVTVGGLPAASIIFSGLTPGFLGIYQINVQLPVNVPAGAQTPLVVAIGGQRSPTIALPTR
jgi:uncharacterized protein (TIGR03437 family)